MHASQFAPGRPAAEDGVMPCLDDVIQRQSSRTNGDRVVNHNVERTLGDTCRIRKYVHWGLNLFILDSRSVWHPAPEGAG